MTVNIMRGRQVILTLTNKSGGDVVEGDVVVVDNAEATCFTTTTTEGLTDEHLGVAIETIADNAVGRVCISGYVDVINLDGAANILDWVKTDSVAKQATPTATAEAGSFGQVLGAGITPPATLFNPSISTGPAGGQGAQGDQGDQGYQGAAGAQGDQGDQGGEGAQGYQGDTGPQGDQGDQGDQGVQGVQGIQGSSGGDSTYTDTYANIPAASNDGDLFLPSNGIALYRDTGAVWSPWGPLYPLGSIPTDGWSWVNQGTATVDTTYGGIYLTAPAADGVNLRCYVRTAPSTPYTITALVHLRMAATGAADGIEAGLCFRESGTSEIATFGLQHAVAGTGEDIWQFITTKFTNETTYSANYARDWQSRFSAHPIWLRIADNGANRICSWSPDGQHWIQVHSVGRTDFLTADQVGIYANAEHATLPMSMMVYSWRAA